MEVPEFICKLTVEMLEHAADEFHAHTCNDYEIENTSENRSFIEKFNKWMGMDDMEDGDIVHDDKICTGDAWLMQYLAEYFKGKVNL